jgi:L-cysteine:1D-myo-inositol 2-amino-2-deoxy-alpha-D-glucopyranoside ligase
MNPWPKPHIAPLSGLSFPNLKLMNSKKVMTTIEPATPFKIYVCGITPYDATHLGHAATYVAFDLINRYQHLAGNRLDFVENITDIDDPLLVRAKRDSIDWKVLAENQIDLFLTDMTALRVIPPNNLVTVTSSMKIIEDFITLLDQRGFLYQIENDHYFSVERFLEDMPLSSDEAIKIFSERGGDPERAGKRHPLDPVVWMAHQGDDPSWESKFGLGRPGWHVECTAIAVHYLDSANADPIIQIQGGGSDLIFPHHYMSEQIVRAAYGRGFANNYVHSAMIHLDGEKMSKSKGNLVFVSKLLSQGIDPMVIRWALLSGHYQQDRSWSDELLQKSTSEVSLLRSALAQSEVAETKELIQSIISDLANNLDTPAALNRLIAWAKSSQSSPKVNESGLVSRGIDSLLGLAL